MGQHVLRAMRRLVPSLLPAACGLRPAPPTAPRPPHHPNPHPHTHPTPPQVLLIGVNNIERGPQPADDLDGLIKWLQQAYPGTHLIVLNLLPTDVDVYLDIEGTNKQYKRVAAEVRVWGVGGGVGWAALWQRPVPYWLA